MIKVPTLSWQAASNLNAQRNNQAKIGKSRHLSVSKPLIILAVMIFVILLEFS